MIMTRSGQVDVGSTCDDFMKMLGFESDYVFIRSGHLFYCGSEDRCCIQISELHKMMQANQVLPLRDRSCDCCALTSVLCVVLAAACGADPEARDGPKRLASRQSVAGGGDGDGRRDGFECRVGRQDARRLLREALCLRDPPQPRGAQGRPVAGWRRGGGPAPSRRLLCGRRAGPCHGSLAPGEPRGRSAGRFPSARAPSAGPCTGGGGHGFCGGRGAQGS